MRKISILIPTYNEEENVQELTNQIIEEFKQSLPLYEYEIVFIDNDSQDNTRSILRGICSSNSKIKAIFNAKNFGQNNSPYYGLMQTTGDCTIAMCADFQDPVNMIPKLIKRWEEGYKIVSAIKTTSKENKVMRFFRTCYYKIINKMSSKEMIQHFTGFGLYDRDFIKILRELKEPLPFLRGIVAEYGYSRAEVPYEQEKRRAGKSKNNFWSLYDIAMLSFTSYTKVGLRIATLLGFLIAGISFLVALIYLVLKIIYWDSFNAGMAPILIGMFLLGAIQLIFIGFIGEYILSINERVMNRPLVIEEERINF